MSDALKELAGFGDDDKAHDEPVERLTTAEPDKQLPRQPLPDLLQPDLVKALDRDDKRAVMPIAAFKKLYEIEAELRDHRRQGLGAAGETQA